MRRSIVLSLPPQLVFLGSYLVGFARRLLQADGQLEGVLVGEGGVEVDLGVFSELEPML
jgi:hypothetical protein